MTSADFLRFNYISLCSFKYHYLPRKTSRGKSSHFPLIYRLHLLNTHSDCFGLCLVSQTHPEYLALYVVRVPTTKILPNASFRFHLTMDTLAFG